MVAELLAEEGEVSHQEDVVALAVVELREDVADRGEASPLGVVAVAVVVSLLAVDGVASRPGAEAAIKKVTGGGRISNWLNASYDMSSCV